VQVHVNSIGDGACRPAYIAALRDERGLVLVDENENALITL
jgi:hypothetical protein